jgi:hypothetical protein
MPARARLHARRTQTRTLTHSRLVHTCVLGQLERGQLGLAAGFAVATASNTTAVDARTMISPALACCCCCCGGGGGCGRRMPGTTPAGDTISFVLSVALPIAAAALVLVLVLAFRRTAAADAQDARVRRAARALRTRLGATRAAGYYLTSERLPPWRSAARVVWLRPSYLEAAARLDLLRNFDPKLVDAFCVCLRGDEPPPPAEPPRVGGSVGHRAAAAAAAAAAQEAAAARNGSAGQYSNSRAWLIELAQLLLDPFDSSVPSAAQLPVHGAASAVLAQDWAHASAAVRPSWENPEWADLSRPIPSPPATQG